MEGQSLETYNVIAAFPEEEAARQAVAKLHDAGIDARHISYLGTASSQRARHPDHPHPEIPEGTSAEEVPAEAAKGVAGGGAAGAAAGGAVGFFAGLVALGIPGAGPLVGTGVWAATAGGAAAGATAGGVSGGIAKMWEAHYKDTVSGGGALVGVHSEDQAKVHSAAQILANEHPKRVDHLDPQGNLLDE